MRKNHQIFTPDNYVEQLLDSIDYYGDIVDKKILENACGDGNILTAIVKRYIYECKNKRYQKKQIAKSLEENIYGFEIDIVHYNNCINNLNQLLSQEKIDNIEWKIFNKDYLKSEFDFGFDYVVSNPPYINYLFLDDEEKEFLKTNFESCSVGKFDYCYAFIEKSFLDLNEMGKMSYLIPSSIFKNVFGLNLRNILKSKLEKIYDFTTTKVFQKVLVASAIIVIDKNKNNNIFEYIDIVKNENKILNINDLDNKWTFSKKKNEGSKRFGDYFQVSHVVATLLNKAYILPSWEEDDTSYIIGDYKIEKDIVYDTSSPRSFTYKKNFKIIFPYYYSDGKLMKYEIEEFEERFPNGVEYLNQYRNKLNTRKKDTSAKWFEYGRSQALVHLNQSKLLTSTIVSNKVKCYVLDNNNIPYSGLFIIEKTDKYALSAAKMILESSSFLDYVNRVGTHINGESIRITSKDIMEFKF